MEQQERLGALFAGRCFAAVAGVLMLGLWPNIYGVGVAVLALAVSAAYSWSFALGRMSMGSDPNKVAAIHSYVDVVLALGVLMVVASLLGKIVTVVMIVVMFFAFLAVPYRRSGIPLADKRQSLWLADVLAGLVLIGVLFWTTTGIQLLAGFLASVFVMAAAVFGQMRLNRKLAPKIIRFTPEPKAPNEPFDPEKTQRMDLSDLDEADVPA